MVNSLYKVIIYTKDICGYCDRAKNFFKSKNINYTEYNINKEPKKSTKVKKSSEVNTNVSCEYCNKEDHQMWMIYDYKLEKWNMSDEEWLNICGTPHPLYNNKR